MTMSQMPEPKIRDLIGFAEGWCMGRPGCNYRIEEVRGYYPREGWGVLVHNANDPSDRFSITLHEDYCEWNWWWFVRRAGQ